MIALTVEQQLQSALDLHQQGRAQEAERIYRAVLAGEPRHPDALHLLGALRQEAGDLAEARRLIEQAVAVAPQTGVFHLSLGNVCQAAGDPERALGAWRRAAELDATLVEARANIATLLAALGRREESADAWRDATRAAPQWAEGHVRLGEALAELDRTDEAVAAFQAALARDASRHDARNALGCALAKRKDFPGAVAAFAAVAAAAPRHAPVHVNLGQALFGAQRFDDAVHAFRRATEAAPDHGGAWHGLATALKELSRLDDAERAACRALELVPNYALAHQGLANIRAEQGLIDEAIAGYRAALALDPTHRKSFTSLLLMLHYSEQHERDPGATLAEHLRWAKTFADPLASRARPHENVRDPARRLRVGYVSPDLHRHPCGFSILPVIEGHDREAVEVFCYSDTRAPDAITDQIRAAAAGADHWRDTSRDTDEHLAERIRADRIDVLVELAGHTARNRLLCLAMKPAPVQVTYLGYPDTTGTRAVDYKLTDAWHDPPGLTEQLYVERLARLPGGAWCLRPRADVPGVNPLPADTNGFVTFFSANKVTKLARPMLQTWRRLLEAVPRARLMILTGGDASGARRIHDAMREIDPARLRLVGRTTPENYYRLYLDADVALDAFPYNGYMTTWDSLYMGLPVVSRAGRTHVSRSGVSLLSKGGLEDWICATEDAYVARAARAASEVDVLRELRATMRARMHDRGMFDGRRLARELEDAYRQMWRAWCAG